MERLKVIPFYTGIETIEGVLKDKKSLGLLWLEILFNDSIDWKSYVNSEEVRSAYEKACVWYTNFKSIIEEYVHRQPLKIRREKIDDREYRKFLEALNFVAA